MTTTAPFALPVATKVALPTVFPDGLAVREALDRANAHDLTVCGMGPDGVVLRASTRAYLKLGVTADGQVADRILVEGDDAAELDRRLWFTFRGLRDRVAAELRVGAAARDVVRALRALAPIGLDHIGSTYRDDLGSLRLYHLVGGGVIGLEVDPLGAVTAASLLPPQVGQGAVLALEAQDREAPLAWDEPRPARGLRAALDDVLDHKAAVVTVRELDPDGDVVEVVGRGDESTRRYRYRLGGSGKVDA